MIDIDRATAIYETRVALFATIQLLMGEVDRPTLNEAKDVLAGCVANIDRELTLIDLEHARAEREAS